MEAFSLTAATSKFWTTAIFGLHCPGNITFWFGGISGRVLHTVSEWSTGVRWSLVMPKLLNNVWFIKASTMLVGKVVSRPNCHTCTVKMYKSQNGVIIRTFYLDSLYFFIDKKYTNLFLMYHYLHTRRQEKRLCNPLTGSRNP